MPSGKTTKRFPRDDSTSVDGKEGPSWWRDRHWKDMQSRPTVEKSGHISSFCRRRSGVPMATGVLEAERATGGHSVRTEATSPVVGPIQNDRSQLAQNTKCHFETHPIPFPRTL
ncbi:sugar-binding protein [Anopheles sinensis]|uniref:Sugar-binding protein n=1 Tax=Anopheles sinensis TaxID=74873 RepID=A0A084WG20_ANOSI|nr:sugar-binding protein [Anopheles sinensis]